MDTVIKILIAVVYGIILGIITILLSRRLILNRTEETDKADTLKKASVYILFLVLGMGASTAVMLTAQTTALAVRNLLLLIPIFGISCVDAVIRKIPNSLLLSMIVIQLAYAVYFCITEKSAELVGTMLGGAIISMLVCSIPPIFKIPIGAGDIKYSGVIGLSLYAFGYFQSMILMAVFVAIYFVYLKVKKKGGMKTQIPMGPFLSIGTVISMCFSVFDFIG